MFLINTIIVVLIMQKIDSQLIGKGCVSDLGKSGRCVRFRKFPGVIESAHSDKLPRICGFQGVIPVICCQDIPQPIARSNKRESITKRKCQEYTLRSIMATASNYFYSSWRNGGFGLVGGVDAIPLEFPHMAVLGYGTSEDIQWRCGGSLISEKFILTAAHCITSKMKNVEHIKLGAHKLSGDEQTFGVRNAFKHPNYVSSQNYHDIALIELDRPANIRTDVRPACLHSSEQLPSNTFIATGWGAMEAYGNIHDTLQKINLSYVPIEKCASYYTNQRSLNNGIVNEWQICADGADTVADTCQGDSGGPLQIKSDESSNIYTIIGITSFGLKCAVSPGVYTRVSYYVSWIESIVWPDE